MPSNDIRIEDAGREGAELALEWAKQEGWNPGLHDIDAFYAADPHGYRVAYRGDEAIGTYSMVRYDDRFAFAGFYVARKEDRGHGLGRLMLDNLLKEAAPYNLGADGVVAMVPTYERHSFRQHFRSGRYRGEVKGKKDPAMRTLDDVGFDAVDTYDCGIFLHRRHAFLKEFLNARDTHVAVSVDSSGRMNGYGVLRKCCSGHKLAPLFAESPEVAEKIFRHLTAFAEHEVYLDVPDPNAEGMALAVRHGMKEVFACARIYTKAPEPIHLQKVFGITSFELG
jgi:GNAT superfamily N-acetyltransferase